MAWFQSTEQLKGSDVLSSKDSFLARIETKIRLSEEHITYIQTVIANQYMPGQSVPDFLQQFAQTQPERASFFERLTPETQARLVFHKEKTLQKFGTLGGWAGCLANNSSLE